MAKAIFVTGTGTDVGKTYVTGLLLKKMNEMGKKAAYYKAAMSGNERDSEGNLIPWRRRVREGDLRHWTAAGGNVSLYL